MDRSALLAVSLALVTLLSAVVVPVAGAGPADAASAGALDDAAGAGDPVTKGGPPANRGSGGGSGSGSAGGGSAGDSNGGSADGGSAGGDSGGSAGGNDGGSGGGGASSNGDSDGAGSGGSAASGSGGGDSGGSTNGGDSGRSSGGASAGAGDGGSDARGSAGGTGSGTSSSGGSDARTGGSDGRAGPAGNPDGGGDGEDRAGDGPAPRGSKADGSNNDDKRGGPPEHATGDGDDHEPRGPPEHANGPSSGDGPAVTVSSGGSAGGEGEGADAPPGRSGDGPSPSVVEVSVAGAEAGDHVDLDVSPSSVEDEAVAFEGISVTVKRDGDFTMRVTNSREALPGSPSFDPDDAAESLGRIRLDHSISNDEVEEVSYTFRVSKAHLRATGTDFEDVALYRHAEGEWSELPTDVVGETATHYVLSADSPGMSEFAVGAKRPAFDAYWADVDETSVEAGQSVTASGRVTNHGGADGVFDARLAVDGEVVAERSVTIAAGGTRQVNFRTTLDEPGEARVAISGVHAGEVAVEARPSESRSAGVDGGLAVVVDRLLDVGQALGVVSTSADGG